MWTTLLLTFALNADALTPGRAAQLIAETDAAQAVVTKGLGKSPLELKGEERVRYVRALNAAKEAVLTKAGVDATAFAAYQLKHQKEITQAQDAQRRAAASTSGPAPVVIEAGTGEGGGGTGEVVIEQGSPGASKKGKRGK